MRVASKRLPAPLHVGRPLHPWSRRLETLRQEEAENCIEIPLEKVTTALPLALVAPLVHFRGKIPEHPPATVGHLEAILRSTTVRWWKWRTIIALRLDPLTPRHTLHGAVPSSRDNPLLAQLYVVTSRPRFATELGTSGRASSAPGAIDIPLVLSFTLGSVISTPWARHTLDIVPKNLKRPFKFMKRAKSCRRG